MDWIRLVKAILLVCMLLGIALAIWYALVMSGYGLIFMAASAAIVIFIMLIVHTYRELGDGDH